MTKVAIKNENITSFGGIYHIMEVFSKLGFEKPTESVLGKRGSSGKAFSHGNIFGRRVNRQVQKYALLRTSISPREARQASAQCVPHHLEATYFRGRLIYLRDNLIYLRGRKNYF